MPRIILHQVLRALRLTRQRLACVAERHGRAQAHQGGCREQNLCQPGRGLEAGIGGERWCQLLQCAAPHCSARQHLITRSEVRDSTRISPHEWQGGVDEFVVLRGRKPSRRGHKQDTGWCCSRSRCGCDKLHSVLRRPACICRYGPRACGRRRCVKYQGRQPGSQSVRGSILSCVQGPCPHNAAAPHCVLLVQCRAPLGPDCPPLARGLLIVAVFETIGSPHSLRHLRPLFLGRLRICTFLLQVTLPLHCLLIV